MPGSQGESGGSRKKFGPDTLRPVTIKQLLEAHHPNADAEYFMIDGQETSQITFVGQVRNISTQTTNVTYKLDDGTGIIEVKMWKDVDTGDESAHGKSLPTEQSYARVWGRMKAFNNKRHIGAQIIRPIQDFNEIQYHLLEATAVHLHFTRGPLDGAQAQGGANGMTNGNGAQQQGVYNNAGGSMIPAGLSNGAKRVLQCIKDTPQGHEGLHIQAIATQISMEISEVQKAGDELQNYGLVYTTVDDHTWALLDV
jgi:replication factor A2